MKMGKKLSSILLILVMAVCLLSGCGKKDSTKNTTLEGTWEIRERIVTVDGVKDEEDSVILPYKKPIDGVDGVEVIMQQYMQFKNGKVKLFMKITLIGEVPGVSEGMDGVYLVQEDEYSVKDNTITVLSKDEEGNDSEEKVKVTYTIKGNELTMTSLNQSELGERVTVVKLIKVSDSEVAGAIEGPLPFE
ncbi:MAG TPA: hypothetical protein VIK89_10425 [Cytophagaceae bacterium]